MIDRLTSEAYALILIIATGGLLFGAQIMEHQFDMDPCPLCLMQRIWFFFSGLIAYVGLLHNPRWGIYPLLTIFTACVGGAFAIRQLWLQSLPADQVPACGPSLEYMIDALPFTEVLKAMTSGTGDCAEVVWSFGLTLPGWALVGFVVVAGVAVLQWRAKG